MILLHSRGSNDLPEMLIKLPPPIYLAKVALIWLLCLETIPGMLPEDGWYTELCIRHGNNQLVFLHRAIIVDGKNYQMLLFSGVLPCPTWKQMKEEEESAGTGLVFRKGIRVEPPKSKHLADHKYPSDVESKRERDGWWGKTNGEFWPQVTFGTITKSQMGDMERDSGRDYILCQDIHTGF